MLKYLVFIHYKVYFYYYSRTPLVWKFNYPNRLGLSGKHFILIVLHLFMA